VKKPTPKLSSDDQPIVPPPSSMDVDLVRTPVLFLPDGKVLVRRIGF
jgi:hypothetical protein